MSEHVDLKMKSKLYHYAALVTSVYDGDTMTVQLDLGLGTWRHELTIRLWRVNTPELRGPDRERGLEVRDFVRSLALGKTVLLRTILDKRGEDRTGKYGRLLGEVLVPGDDLSQVETESGGLVNLNELLLAQGMGLEMTEEGSTVRGLAGTLPTTIDCPFCGQERSVDAARLVEQCPNCLDRPRPLSDLLLQG